LLNAHFENEIQFSVETVDKNIEKSERQEKISKIVEEIKTLD